LAPFSGCLTKLADTPDQHHADEGGGGINAAIDQRRSPAGHEYLVELIGKGVATRQEHRPQRCPRIPIKVLPALDACKDQQAEDAVFGQVGGLAKVMVKQGKSGLSDMNVKEMEDGG